jgi:hypothetical protein
MTGLPDLKKDHANSLAVDPSDPNTVYLAVSGPVGPGAGGVYVSRDGARTWAWMGQGLPPGEPFFRQDIWVTGREIAADSAGNLVALSRDRKRVFRFDAGPKTWKNTEAGAALGGGAPFSVVSESKTPGSFLLGGDRVLLSRDGGRTWRALDRRLPYRAGNLVAFAGDRVIVGTLANGAYWMPLTPAASRPITARR